MLKNWVVTKAQMRNVVREHRKCRGERSRIEGDKAVVRYATEPRVCSPYFLRLEDGEWRIDFAAMQKAIRFDQHNHWHMWTPNEFSFAFPELKPTRTNNRCRWCFTYRNDTLVITSIGKDSAAEKMGMKKGDKMVAIDGTIKPGTHRAFDHLFGVKAGKSVSFTVLRDGETLTLTYPAPPK